MTTELTWRKSWNSPPATVLERDLHSTFEQMTLTKVSHCRKRSFFFFLSQWIYECATLMLIPGNPPGSFSNWLIIHPAIGWKEVSQESDLACCNKTETWLSLSYLSQFWRPENLIRVPPWSQLGEGPLTGRRLLTFLCILT